MRHTARDRRIRVCKQRSETACVNRPYGSDAAVSHSPIPQPELGVARWPRLEGPIDVAVLELGEGVVPIFPGGGSGSMRRGWTSSAATPSKNEHFDLNCASYADILLTLTR